MEAPDGRQRRNFNGLAKRSPFLAFAMLIAMASLAGLPFTAGFLGKFYIFNAAIAQQQTTLIVVGVITVACGFYYYFKVVRAMYWEAPVGDVAVPVSGVSRVAMLAMMAGIIILGIYPQPVLSGLIR